MRFFGLRADAYGFMTIMFDIENYDYYLPPELIAQAPCTERDQSRLCLVDRSTGTYSDRSFHELWSLVGPGDLIVVNDTKVFPAKLFGRKASGGKVEILILDHRDVHDGDRVRRCLMKSSKRPVPGVRLFFDGGLAARIESVPGNGMVNIEFEDVDLLEKVLDEFGRVPLPPYIKRVEDDPRIRVDRERYQTVYSRPRGSVAAPTAGLHFTDLLMQRIIEAGARFVFVTLHVGYGTFKPVRVDDIRRHSVDEECYDVSPEAAAAINETRKSGGRVIAVGTTVVRTLETVGIHGGNIEPQSGVTELMITPGHSFKVVDALITNFHLPRSSLLFLVSAFAGRDLIMRVYEHAVRNSYRFFSYGDAMFIV
jgi:S-adenosylmethionine:tRNA ribosyltransferase-isomerase